MMPHTPARMAAKKDKITSVGKDVRKGNPRALLVKR